METYLGTPRDINLSDEIAEAGIDALAEFVREIGMPSTFTEMGISDKSYKC